MYEMYELKPKMNFWKIINNEAFFPFGGNI